MTSEMIDIQMADGVSDAYVSRPADSRKLPGVLLMHDIFGLRPQIESMADRIADAGYVVLAPNLFFREGRAPLFDGQTPDMNQRQVLGASLTQDRSTADGATYLDQLDRIASGPFGVTGYCMGGRTGWWLAAAQPERVAALGVFHAGRMVTEGADSAHLLAPEIQAEVFLGHADNDPNMTAESIATIERALDLAGVTYRSEVFEGAAHGYTMADHSERYDEAATARHFDELLALFGRTLTTQVS